MDKLAAGWSVRVKERKNGNDFCNITELQGIDMRAFIEADWEGIPSVPTPKLRHDKCSIVFAFMELEGSGCEFIRREDWAVGQRINSKNTNYTLNAEDILSNDWEIWV